MIFLKECIALMKIMNKKVMSHSIRKTKNSRKPYTRHHYFLKICFSPLNFVLEYIKSGLSLGRFTKTAINISINCRCIRIYLRPIFKNQNRYFLNLVCWWIFSLSINFFITFWVPLSIPCKMNLQHEKLYFIKILVNF